MNKKLPLITLKKLMTSQLDTAYSQRMEILEMRIGNFLKNFLMEMGAIQ